MSYVLSENVLFRVGQRARLELDIDPFLCWGLLAYPHIAQSAAELDDGDIELALALVDDDVELSEPFRTLLDAMASEVPAQLAAEGRDPDACALPGTARRSPAARVLACVRRLGEYLEEHGDDILMAPHRPRPAGAHWVDVGDEGRALVDGVTLETLDVDGRLIGLDIAGVPGSGGATPAADAIGSLAASEWALEATSDLGRVVLLQQRTAALRSSVLDWAVREPARERAAAAAAAAGRGLGSDGLLRLGLSLETLRETAVQLGTLDPARCQQLVADLVDAAPGLVADALDAVATADREIAAIASVYASPPDDRRAEREAARRAGLRAAVRARRGLPAVREWAIAMRRWEPLSFDTSERCRQLQEESEPPALLTLDAVVELGGYQR